mmetsp:Transcript_17095/g.29261  ORF Transcript_17095/g.29261 Transcript_17095/m.29261 type:complete len:101 (-) Transcript_17095:840-1142(-)
MITRNYLQAIWIDFAKRPRIPLERFGFSFTVQQAPTPPSEGSPRWLNLRALFQTLLRPCLWNKSLKISALTLESLQPQRSSFLLTKLDKKVRLQSMRHRI